MEKVIRNEILKQLYHGDICPVESLPSNNAAYVNASSKIVAIIDELEQKAITAEEHYLLENLQEWYSVQNMMELESAFEQGFCLGAQIMMRVQGSNIGNISVEVSVKEIEK